MKRYLVNLHSVNGYSCQCCIIAKNEEDARILGKKNQPGNLQICRSESDKITTAEKITVIRN